MSKPPESFLDTGLPTHSLYGPLLHCLGWSEFKPPSQPAASDIDTEIDRICIIVKILDGDGEIWRVIDVVSIEKSINHDNKPWAWHLGVSFAFGGFIVGYPLLNAMGFFLPPSVAQTAPICCNAKGLHSWVTLC